MHDTLSTQRLAEALCRLLPQTQCRQCGFDGCAEYARAMALGTAPINRCAPGGRAGVEKLAAATGQAAGDVDPEYGRELPFAAARIDAARCIGCRLCDAACPVGCITGLPKHLFAVIEPECTGCGLCMCACPVNAVEWSKPATFGAKRTPSAPAPPTSAPESGAAAAPPTERRSSRAPRPTRAPC